MTPRRTENSPHDRLTRICARMTDAMDADPEHRDGDRAIIMLDDGWRGGIVLHGYDSDLDGLADLLAHVRAIFEANGKTLALGVGDDLMSAAVSAIGPVPDDAGGA